MYEGEFHHWQFLNLRFYARKLGCSREYALHSQRDISQRQITAGHQLDVVFGWLRILSRILVAHTEIGIMPTALEGEVWMEDRLTCRRNEKHSTFEYHKD